jgi:putative transcriptional regulator
MNHHPDDDLLLAHAAGTLPTGTALVVAAHIEGCPHCQAQLRLCESIGSVLMDELPEAPLRADALARTLAAIDALPPVPPPRPTEVAGPPPLPAGAAWPKSLAGCRATPWRWMGPGMRWSRVTVPYDPAANVFLLRIGAGKYLPQHTHSELEVTQVLHGRFHDGRALFEAGDFDAADGQVRHQPVVQEGSECICLAAVEGRVVFDGFIARTLGSLVGM